LRLLTGVWVLCTVEDVKLLGRGTGKLVVWHHANHCFFDYARWVCVQELAQGHGAQATRVTGAVAARFRGALVGSSVNLCSVDDDDVVTTVNVWCVLRLVLATQHICHGGSKLAQHHIRCVDDVPLTGNVTALWVESRQNDSLELSLGAAGQRYVLIHSQAAAGGDLQTMRRTESDKAHRVYSILSTPAKTKTHQERLKCIA